MKACSTTSPFPDLPWWRHRSPSRHVARVSSCVASIFGNFFGDGGSTVEDQPLDATKKFPILTWFSFPAQPWRSRTCWSSCGPADPTQSGSCNWRNWKKPPNGLFWTRSDRIDRKQVWQVFLARILRSQIGMRCNWQSNEEFRLGKFLDDFDWTWWL